jgi:hypothetical protein
VQKLVPLLVYRMFACRMLVCRMLVCRMLACRMLVYKNATIPPAPTEAGD